jgi:DNA-binding MarR family transcriptional regulator
METTSTGYLLGRLVFGLERASERLLQARLGISYKRFIFLTVLEHAGIVTQHELAQALGYSDPAVSMMVVELAKEGFLEISLSPDHGRKHLVAMTKHGSDLVAQGREILDSHFDQLAVSAEVDTRQLRDSAERLYLALKQKTQGE